MLTRDLFATATVLVHAVMGWMRSARNGKSRPRTSNAVLQSATTLTFVYSAQFVW